jgi:hypothetical protein
MTKQQMLVRAALFGLVMVAPHIAWAQQDGAVSVEGYVFDKKALRPLAGVNVSIIVVAPEGMTTAPSFGGITDDNGFYAISAVPPYEPQGANVMSVVCPTRKGAVMTNSFVYDRIRTDRIYQRNFYLTLPRNVTSCQ